MYIAVSWSPHDESEAATISGEIEDAVHALPFANVFVPFPQCILANIAHGKSRDVVDTLQAALRTVSNGRFLFVVTASPTGWGVWRSPEVPIAMTNAIANY